ncbi:MAG: flagellar biosynthesis anti-sigma factor FlgM [Pseudomonadota bacterium]
MKIENPLTGAAPTRIREAKAAPARPVRSSGRAPGSTDVRLTATSGKMRELETELAGVDVTDSGKIESVRQAIADGRFVVDEEAVADGLIQESVDLIAHRQDK